MNKGKIQKSKNGRFFGVFWHTKKQTHIILKEKKIYKEKKEAYKRPNKRKSKAKGKSKKERSGARKKETYI